MRERYQKVFLRALIWLTAEVLLGFMGLDNLADYSEFVFESRTLIQLNGSSVCIVSPT